MFERYHLFYGNLQSTLFSFWFWNNHFHHLSGIGERVQPGDESISFVPDSDS